MTENKRHELKLVTVGCCFTGKTSVMKYYFKDELSDGMTSTPTVGASFMTKDIDVDLDSNVNASITLEGSDMIKKLRLNCWDTCGMEAHQSAGVTPMYYRNANIVFCMYAINDRITFSKLETVWLPELLRHNEKAFGVIIGNKLDLEEQREVQVAEGKALAEKLGYVFFETSAKNGLNIKTAIESSIRKLLTTIVPSELDEAHNPEDIDKFFEDTKPSRPCSC